jgi:hypothetical protein
MNAICTVLTSCLIASSMIQFDWSPEPTSEIVAKQCAKQLGIPYASDNITEEEFQSFKKCIMKTIK